MLKVGWCCFGAYQEGFHECVVGDLDGGGLGGRREVDEIVGVLRGRGQVAAGEGAGQGRVEGVVASRLLVCETTKIRSVRFRKIGLNFCFFLTIRGVAGQHRSMGALVVRGGGGAFQLGGLVVVVDGLEVVEEALLLGLERGESIEGTVSESRD